MTFDRESASASASALATTAGDAAAPLLAATPSAAPSAVGDATAPSPAATPSAAAVGFMRQALAAAERAASLGEVPVGAVVVTGDRVLAVGHNERETGADPTAHAEIVVLRRAAAALGTWRLTDAELFVTMEPCPMCAGALVNARVRRVYYGCDDPKAGAARTLYRILEDARLNHRVDVVPGVLATESAALLRSFFERLRR